MTTIAANRKEMAGDSRCTDGDTSFRTRKLWRFGDVIVGAAGNNAGIAKFRDWIKEGDPDMEPPKFGKDDELQALVLTPAGIFSYGKDCMPDEILDDFYAVGTGAHAALAAMHLGCSPTDAVAVACKVDNGTGEPVQTMRLADAD